MKLRDKLAKEHPEFVKPNYLAGCRGCPNHYGYEEHGPCYFEDIAPNKEMCRECWDRDESEVKK